MITPTFQDYDNEVVLLPGTVKMYVGKIVKFVELVERKWEQHSPSLKLPSTLQSRNSNFQSWDDFVSQFNQLTGLMTDKIPQARQ